MRNGIMMLLMLAVLLSIQWTLVWISRAGWGFLDIVFSATVLLIAIRVILFMRRIEKIREENR